MLRQMRFVAGGGAVAELLAGSNAAECHREDAADRRCGRADDRLGRSGKVAGRGAAMAKMLLAGAPWRSCWQGYHGRVGGAGEE